MAEKHNGEVINGDALQLYEGLPIATNELPLADRKSIPHHLLGCVKWDEEPWTVRKFVGAATGIIGEIIARGKLPVIVGGTHYYMQSLLFEHSLVNSNTEHRTTQAQETKWPLLAAPTRNMLEALRTIDPDEALRWHPNDRRKIRHSLEVYLTSGRKPSEIYREQRTKSTATSASEASQRVGFGLYENEFNDAATQLRFDPLILWVYADLEKLTARLDQRVETMVQAGLLEEVESMQRFLHEQEQSGIHVDQTVGIWSAIGFKELLPYVSASHVEGLSAKLLMEKNKECIQATKIATRQYARQQQRWIRGKLLQALDEHNALDRMVVLDGSELSLWPQNVGEAANTIVSAFLDGEPIPKTTTTSGLTSEILVPNPKAEIKARYCQICDMTLMTQKEWDAHPKSKKHRRATRTPIDWQALYPRAKTQDPVPLAEFTLDRG